MAARAIIAAVVACLLFFQGAVVAAPKGPVFKSEQASALLAPGAEHCDADAHGGDPGPSPNKNCHSHCCIMCSGGGRDAAPVFLAVAFVVVFYSAPEPSGPAAYPALDEPWKRSSGWASSWSSRAPPFFS